jgi:hypothetical protein
MHPDPIRLLHDPIRLLQIKTIRTDCVRGRFDLCTLTPHSIVTHLNDPLKPYEAHREHRAAQLNDVG